MAKAEERLQSGADLLSVSGEWCPHVSNDHPPVCRQPSGTHCLKCPEYLDGLCDLIPWDEEKMTETQKRLKSHIREKEGYYTELDPIYAKIHAKEDEIQEDLKELRREEGR